MSVACSVLYRPFSELDLDEPYGAPPESAYYGKLVELLDATEREVERNGHVDRARRATTSTEPATALRALHRGRLPPRRDARRRSPRTCTNWRPAACSTSRSRTCSGARSPPTRRRCPFLPDAVYDVALPAGAGRRALAARRGRGPRDVRAPGAGRHQPHARRRDRRDVHADRGARPRDRRRPARLPGDRLPRRLPLRRPEVQRQRRHDRAGRGPRRRDRADLRPAPDQRRPAAQRHEDARRVARRARPPHRRDRRRATSRSAPTSTASSSRRWAGSRPPRTWRRSPPRCAPATPSGRGDPRGQRAAASSSGASGRLASAAP